MAEKIKENKIEEQNRNYEQQLYHYEELFENTRALRHDLKNHFWGYIPFGGTKSG